MSHVNRRSVLVFVSTVLASLTLISPPARAVTTTFDQVSWGNGNGGFVDQNSQSGQATVGFSGADVGSLIADGSGGYYGYVNVVTTVGGGSNNNWAVQNLVVTFNSLSDLSGGSLPTTVNFDLGQADGTAVSTLNYSFTLTSAPLALQPGGPLTSAGVTSDNEVAGTEGDPNGSGGEGVEAATDFSGAVAATGLGRRGTIAGSETNVPAIAEQVNGCAPGAAARSVVYLSRMFPSIVVTQTPQQVYGTMTNNMRSSTGANSSGTLMVTNGNPNVGNFAVGKNMYFATNGLSIAPTVFTNGAGGFASTINSLNSTGDVELWISWGFTVVGGVTNFNGGHAVFVSSVTPITNSLGQIVRYQIRYIEDPNQGGNSTNNQVRVMTVFPNGVDVNTPAGVQGRGAVGFFLENVVVPEPSTIELAALGLGALGFGLTRRQRRRKRT
jgi:PEP-CTERM motif